MTRSAVLRLLSPVALVAAVPLARRVRAGRNRHRAGVPRAFGPGRAARQCVRRAAPTRCPTCRSDAFTILEDGKPQQISFFNNADVPVSVGLVVDNSGSMIARQTMVLAGSLAFADGEPPRGRVVRGHLQRARPLRPAADRPVHAEPDDGLRPRSRRFPPGRQDSPPRRRRRGDRPPRERDSTRSAC